MTGGAAADPINAEVAGIKIKAPPPPEIVEITKAIIPMINKLARCQNGIVCISDMRSVNMGYWSLSDWE